MSKQPKEDECMTLVDTLPDIRKALIEEITLDRRDELLKRWQDIDDRYSNLLRDYPKISGELRGLLRQEIRILKLEEDFVEFGDIQKSQYLYDVESGVYSRLVWLLRSHVPTKGAFKPLETLLRRGLESHQQSRDQTLEKLNGHMADAQTAMNFVYACRWSDCIDHLNPVMGRSAALLSD